MMILKVMQAFIVNGPLKVTEAGIQCTDSPSCGGCFFHTFYEKEMRYGCGAKSNEDEFFKEFPEYKI